MEDGQTTVDSLLASPRIEQDANVKFNNLIARNWRGEFPLWVTYWVFGFLGNVATVAIVAGVTTSLSAWSDYDPRATLAALVTLWGFAALVSCWQLVAVWRSATRVQHTSSWAGLAKASAILGALSVIIKIGSSCSAPSRSSHTLKL
jgi:hypothetical protein